MPLLQAAAAELIYSNMILNYSINIYGSWVIMDLFMYFEGCPRPRIHSDVLYLTLGNICNNKLEMKSRTSYFLRA